MKDHDCHESFCKKTIFCAQHSVHFSTVINPNNTVFFSKNVFQIQRKEIQTRSPAKRKTRKVGEVNQTNNGLVLLQLLFQSD